MIDRATIVAIARELESSRCLVCKSNAQRLREWLKKHPAN